MFLIVSGVFTCFKRWSYLLDLRFNVRLIFMSPSVLKTKTWGAVELQEHPSSAKRKPMLSSVAHFSHLNSVKASMLKSYWNPNSGLVVVVCFFSMYSVRSGKYLVLFPENKLGLRSMCRAEGSGLQLSPLGSSNRFSHWKECLGVKSSFRVNSIHWEYLPCWNPLLLQSGQWWQISF